MSFIRTLTHEEFAQIRAKGTAYTEQFIQERVKQIAAAGLVEKKAGLLRDTHAAEKIKERIQSSDIDGMTALLEKLDTAIIWQKETEESIREKARHYYTEKEFSDLAARRDPWDRLPFMKAHMDSLHLTPEQRRRLDRHDTSKTPVDLKLRKILRQNCKRGTATLNMHLGLIGSNGHHHATPYELKMRNDQKGRWRKFGESVTLTRGDEEISMLDVMKSAGKKKLAETLKLTKGLENYAKAAGMTWAFVTLTAPPRMHPNPKNGHSSWDGTTPDEAHEWILDAYQKAEARLRTTHGIVISGLRVVESHDDACPHWHVLIFAHAHYMDTIEAAFRQQKEWKSEVGMEFTLNDGTASAVSYVFKYITKTINSIEKLEGEHGTVDAWRSTWGIRAFQFFGMPPMKLWRNLRAVKECPEEPLVADLWRAANGGDAQAYIRLAGGLNVKAKDRPVITRTTGDGQTKTIEFILQETSESIRFNIEKWQQTKATKSLKANKTVGLGVILSYPRRSKTKSEPIEFAYAAAQGNDSLDPDKGRECLIRGFPYPSSLPTLSPVGIAEGQTKNQHGTGALVGALQDRIQAHAWWEGIDMKKAPSLAKFNEIRKKTGKAIYLDCAQH